MDSLLEPKGILDNEDEKLSVAQKIDLSSKIRNIYRKLNNSKNMNEFLNEDN